MLLLSILISYIIGGISELFIQMSQTNLSRFFKKPADTQPGSVPNDVSIENVVESTLEDFESEFVQDEMTQEKFIISVGCRVMKSCHQLCA